MNDKSIVFEKARKLFLGGGFDESKYYFTFSPFAIEFTNQDFNFLNGETKSADETRDDYNDKWVFSRLANTINRNEHIWNIAQDERIFDEDRYALVLQKALRIDTALSDEDKQVYEAARKVLYKDADPVALNKTDEYKTYQDYAGKVAALQTTIDTKNQARQTIDNSNAEAINKWQQEFDEMDTQLTLLKTDWEIHGFRQVVDDALRKISRTNDKANFYTSWTQHLNEFTNLVKENNPVSNIEFLPTFCNPAEIYQPDYSGWKKIVINEDELKQLDDEARTFLGDEVYNSFDSIGVTFNKIEFEILFVEIARSWLRKDLLESRFWKFGDDVKDFLSSGTDLKTGLIPSYPSQMVFVRHLKYTSPESVTQPATGGATSFKAVRKYVFEDMVSARTSHNPSEAFVVKYQVPKIGNVLGGKPLIFLQPAGDTHAEVTIRDHRALTSAVGGPRISTDGAGSPFVWVKDHWERRRAQPATPALATLTLSVTDSKSNLLENIEVHLKSGKTGADFQGITTGDGKLVIPGLEQDNYSININDEEYFEDYHEVFTINSDLNKSIVLVSRAKPKIRFSLLGIINYKLPKLPNPLDGATYL